MNDSNSTMKNDGSDCSKKIIMKNQTLWNLSAIASYPNAVATL